MKRIAILMIAGLVSGSALAVEGEAAAPAAAESTAAPAPAATEHKATEAKPKAKPEKAADKEKSKDADKSKDKKQAEKAKPALSKQAYVKLLAAEIKRHTPKASDAQTGSIHVAFTIGAGGRVVSHKVQSASNPALEPVVNQILAAVHTVSPPGGSFSAVQEFNFH
ncbi:energy transducer TonB [Methylosinus sporium]|uniref:energy transducer TonB n=1 Tax=Methylosinus sporium TaxID=428 RepID=UPI00383B4899